MLSDINRQEVCISSRKVVEITYITRDMSWQADRLGFDDGLELPKRDAEFPSIGIAQLGWGA
jgi:hypothetical protein